MRERTKTVEEIVDFGGFYFQDIDPMEELKKQFYTPDIAVFKAIKGRFEQMICGTRNTWKTP